MKKLILLATLFVFFLAVPAFAQVSNWHIANQATVGWDAVTQLDNGDPLPAGDVVQYVVLLANALTDPNKTNPAEVGTVTALEYTVTLNVEGRYLVGIRAERIVEGTKVSESIVAWSDDPAYVANGETFGLSYFRPLKAVGGLGPK
jgi:hypothetical protein